MARNFVNISFDFSFNKELNDIIYSFTLVQYKFCFVYFYVLHTEIWTRDRQIDSNDMDQD